MGGTLSSGIPGTLYSGTGGTLCSGIAGTLCSGRGGTLYSGVLSKALFAATVLKHQAVGTAIHADNGHPMRGLTLMALFQQLSINVSHSRPRTSNDNPYLESWFKTMKYKGSYPRSFETIEDAREWMAVFVDWYNHTHLHSGLDYVTPAQVRYHDAEAIFKQRNATIMKAKEAFPERWGTRKVKVWEAPQTVILNPDYQ